MVRNCFACGKQLDPTSKNGVHYVDTRDDQWVIVGHDCYKNIKRSAEFGWMPKKGGLRLWTIPEEAWMNQGPRITGKGSNE